MLVAGACDAPNAEAIRYEFQYVRMLG
jgi:hypothetical protein